jgi:hypothetical protein
MSPTDLSDQSFRLAELEADRERHQATVALVGPLRDAYERSSELSPNNHGTSYLRFLQRVEVICLILDVAICGHEKPARTRGGVLNDFPCLGLHQANHAIN